MGREVVRAPAMTRHPRRNHAAVREDTNAYRHVDMVVYRLAFRSESTMRTLMSGKVARTSLTAASTYKRPKTIGAAMMRSPLGVTYSPDAARSASPTCSRTLFDTARWAAAAQEQRLQARGRRSPAQLAHRERDRQPPWIHRRQPGRSGLPAWRDTDRRRHPTQLRGRDRGLPDEPRRLPQSRRLGPAFSDASSLPGRPLLGAGARPPRRARQRDRSGPTESGALTGMMGLSPEQAEAVKERERERIPLKRRGHPNDVARWIVSLADPASEWVTGQVIAVDGGLGLA